MNAPKPVTFDDIAKANPGDPAAQLTAIAEIRERAIDALPETVGDVVRLTSVMRMLLAQVNATSKVD